MSGTLNKHAFTALLKEDVDWLLANSKPCLEQDHILAVLKETESLRSELELKIEAYNDLRISYETLDDAMIELVAENESLHTENGDISLKDYCINFYYWWHNQPGTNTQDGFEDWLAAGMPKPYLTAL